MNDLILKICEDLTKKFKSNKNVIGIMLFGSAARNKFDQYSDVDIFIVLKNKQKFSRSSLVKSGLRIDIIFNTRGDLERYLKYDKYNVRRITSHMLAHGQVLCDSTRELKKFKAIAVNNLKLKTKYTKDEVLMHKYSIDDFWGEVQRDYKNKDSFAFGWDTQLLMQNIIELFLKLKGEFLRQPNDMADLIKKIDKNFGNQVEQFYKIRDPKNKLEILSKIIDHIYKISEGPLPGKWEIK